MIASQGKVFCIIILHYLCVNNSKSQSQVEACMGNRAPRKRKCPDRFGNISLFNSVAKESGIFGDQVKSKKIIKK